MFKYPKIQSPWKRDKDGKFDFNEFTNTTLKMLATTPMCAQEKIDGTNVRVMYDGGGSVWYGGRTDKAETLKQWSDLGDFVQKSFPLNKMQEVFGDKKVVVFGEGTSPAIQKAGNTYGLSAHFWLFDVVELDENGKPHWWPRSALDGLASKFHVTSPKYLSNLITIWEIADMLDKRAKGEFEDVFKEIFPRENVEGFVLRPMEELVDPRGNRVITKVKVKDFK